MDFYQVGIDRRVQPSLALSVEKEELGIGAGLQDRVIQVYEGLVAMDFTEAATEWVDGYECGQYGWVDPAKLPPLYIAYRADLSEPTEVVHNDLRARYDRGDAEVVQAMRQFAALADRAGQALDAGDHQALAEAINANFDLRRSICRLHPGHVQMVECARQAGATAKFAGSGGAIVGTYPDPGVLQRLTTDLAALGCRVLRPTIVARLPSTSAAV